MPQEIQRNFGKAVKVIYDLFLPDQQELMRIPFEAMTGYVKETGDTTSKGAERKFRTFMLLYRHWLISEKKVPADYFGKRFLEATTDELWEEAEEVYRALRIKPRSNNERGENK
ncbi:MULTISPECIES: hypothetical protein [Enterococcus]|uniref:hypothetical protein n=1 Tax=Enterococcus TaxID=1350 RepID=UPI001AD7B466|nr:hypothetical protein [Enterococcus gallinarum]MBO6419162.1 hypothetical protein [Enterococcus gallinarum]MBO6420293.1 hypothetical protein [Enterococcus gallinarum]MDT2677941.1 hypothetical protein [Enterococcus gallinarum]MDT2683420.1 hypothetical protein [Enterococcus gallinarum]